jgi:hypothetical protein
MTAKDYHLLELGGVGGLRRQEGSVQRSERNEPGKVAPHN